MKVVNSNGWTIYRAYLAIKRHYTSEEYDYFKYNGLVKASREKFEDRNDHLMFKHLAKDKDWFDRIIANQAYGNNPWIGDILDDTEYYQKFITRKQSLMYLLQNDIRKFHNFQDACRVDTSMHPEIFQEYIQGNVSLETISIIGHVTRLFNYWDKVMTDPLWKDQRLKIMKHHRFLKYDRQKVLDIVRASV